MYNIFKKENNNDVYGLLCIVCSSAKKDFVIQLMFLEYGCF